MGEERRGGICSRPAAALGEDSRAGWDSHFDPTFKEGVTVEKMRRRGSGLVAVPPAFFFPSLLSWGCGGRFSVMMVRILVGDAV